MDQLNNGDIIPGIGIGWIKIHMSCEDVLRNICEYQIKDLISHDRIVCDDVDIWIDKTTKKVTQIMVKEGFQGKYDGAIGIGSLLSTVIKMGKKYHEELDTYVLDDAPGMCFELGDTSENDSWDELRAPIAYISVFSSPA